MHIIFAGILSNYTIFNTCFVNNNVGNTVFFTVCAILIVSLCVALIPLLILARRGYKYVRLDDWGPSTEPCTGLYSEPLPVQKNNNKLSAPQLATPVVDVIGSTQLSVQPSAPYLVNVGVINDPSLSNKNNVFYNNVV